MCIRTVMHNGSNVIGAFNLMASGDRKVSQCIGWRHIMAEHKEATDKISCLGFFQERRKKVYF